MIKKRVSEFPNLMDNEYTDIQETQIPNQTMPTLPDLNLNPNTFFITDNQKEMEESLNGNKDTNEPNIRSSINASPNQYTITKPKERLNDKKKKLFNKLYGLDTFYVDSYKKAKRLKYFPLEKYQNNLLNVFANHNPDQQNFIDLSSKFRQLRTETEAVTPLPKVDFEKIEEQSKYINKVNAKALTLKQYFAGLNNNSVDEKNQVRFKYISRVKPYNNPVFNKLPSYLLQTLQKKMKLHL